MSRLLVLVALLAASLMAGSSSAASADVPHVKHVFIVVLENQSESTTFGSDTEIPYLADTLKSKGAFVPNYYGIAHASLPNYIAMISGQAPTLENQADCQIYHDVLPGLPTSNGQFIGTGCVYPAGVGTVATQLEGNGFTWRGYMQDMASSAPSEPATCRHPSLNTRDSTQSARANDQYAARHNPFVYFHGITDLPTCQQNDVDLSHLAPDLGSKSTTPSYAFITPDLCNDGHDATCADGGPGGMPQANTFLRSLVPEIMRSPAYRDHGLILITFDEAEGGSGSGDATACCGEQPGPNTVNPGALTVGPGGGKTGAVALSPCITPGTVTMDAYNHYSLLRWVEDDFGLPHLGYAAAAGLKPFGRDILNQPSCPSPGTCKAGRKHKKHKRSAEAAKHKKHRKKKCRSRKKRAKHKH